MEYISFIVTIPKNTPKHFLKIPTSIWTEILAPMIAPKIPNTDISMANFISIFLFFRFTIIATMAVGIKKIKLVAWAICCSTPNIKLKRKIRMVPPPIPVPDTIPDNTPINTSVIDSGRLLPYIKIIL